MITRKEEPVKCDTINDVVNAGVNGALGMYTYEGIITNDNGWNITFPQFGLSVQAKSRKEVIDEGAAALGQEIAKRISAGEQLPEQRHIAEVATISIEPPDEVYDQSLYMTRAEAQEVLGLTHGRIAALVKQGKLIARQFGRQSMVSRASVEAFASTPRKAGRPTKSSH